MDIDYKNIVINGYAQNQKHFDKHLDREFNKVKDKNYGAEEFFDGCLDVVEGIKQNVIKIINDEWYKQEDEIQKSLQLNLKGVDEFGDDYLPGLTYEEKRDYIINFYEHRLDEIYKIKDDKINSLDYTHLIEQIRLAKQVVLKGKKLQPTNIKLRFKDLFKDNESYNESYNKAVNILKENGYVKQSNNILEWIFTPKTGNTIIQTIVALCVVLEKKQYFKPKLKTIYNNIKNEFGISMNKSTYSRSSRAFKRDYNNLTKGTKSYDYISLFKNIL
jgi:hypothetical protein